MYRSGTSLVSFVVNVKFVPPTGKLIRTSAGVGVGVRVMAGASLVGRGLGVVLGLAVGAAATVVGGGARVAGASMPTSSVPQPASKVEEIASSRKRCILETSGNEKATGSPVLRTPYYTSLLIVWPAAAGRVLKSRHRRSIQLGESAATVGHVGIRRLRE